MHEVSFKARLSAGRTKCPRVCRRSTFRRGEEVEEGVVGHRLGDRPHGAAALVLLFLLDGFQRDVLALGPVNRAAEGDQRGRGDSDSQWPGGDERLRRVC